MKAVVFSNELKSLPDLITAATKLGVEEIIAVFIGEKTGDLENLGYYGAKKVIVVRGIPKELETTYGFSEIIRQIVEENNADYVITNSTPFENEIASLLAAKLTSPFAPEVVEIDLKNSEPVIKRSVYGGKLISEIKIMGSPKIFSIAPGAFEGKEISQEKAEIVEITSSVTGEGIKLLEKSEVVVKGKPLEDADIVIGIGRGVKKKEDLSMIYELAELLDAAVGCTRPLAADYGWFEEWIGVSGKRISPKLYIVIGSSGSVQHMAGVRGSKVIVSINKDPEAPIFEESDYLFVADLYKLVPAIIEELKKLK